MNNILEMIKNEKVEWKKLGDVCEIGTGKSNTNQQVENGKYPFYVRSKDIKRIDEYEFDEEAIIIPGEGGIGEIYHYINGKYALHQRAYRIHVLKDYIKSKYVYYYMQAYFYNFILKSAVGSTVSSIRKGMIENFEIPIPSLKTQERIVKILDTMVDHFTQLEAELEAELEARNKQYEYYRDKLLSEEYLNKLTNKFGGEINFFDIKSLCKRNRGMKITAKQMNDLDNPDGEVKIFAAGNTIANVSIEDVGEDNIISEPSVIVKSRGNIDFDYYNKRFSHKNEMWSYTTLDKNVLNVKYLYYYLKNNLEYFKDKAVSGKLPQISTGITDNYKLPVPNIEVQNTIVDFLDRFQAIIQDVDGLLPKEIELRHKQYEYYRERLLDFKRDDE